MALNTNAPSFTYDKVICPHCNVVLDFTPADLLNQPINENICCGKCGKVVVSNFPQTRKLKQTGAGFAIEYEWD